MNEFSNGLTPAQTERLAFLLEELGEAQQVIGKILRHGYESSNPLVVGDPTNREALEREMGDVVCAFGLLADAHDVDRTASLGRALLKKTAVKQWMHHQPDADKKD